MRIAVAVLATAAWCCGCETGGTLVVEDKDEECDREAWCEPPCDGAICDNGAPIVCSANVELRGKLGQNESTCSPSREACGGVLWCCTD